MTSGRAGISIIRLDNQSTAGGGRAGASRSLVASRPRNRAVRRQLRRFRWRRHHPRRHGTAGRTGLAPSPASRGPRCGAIISGTPTTPGGSTFTITGHQRTRHGDRDQLRLDRVRKRSGRSHGDGGRTRDGTTGHVWCPVPDHGPATATNGAATVTQPANLTGPFTDGVRWICTGVQTSNTTVAQLLTDWDATSCEFRQAHQRSDVQWSGDNVPYVSGGVNIGGVSLPSGHEGSSARPSAESPPPRRRRNRASPVRRSRCRRRRHGRAIRTFSITR